MRDAERALPALILLSVAAFAGCATTPCTSESCKADAKITSDVQAHLKEHRELSAPNMVYVQTRGGIVYLTGQVATDLQRDTAESVTRHVPGVVRVVNSIALTYSGW
jgi:osmotically-inducible protein OsmY